MKTRLLTASILLAWAGVASALSPAAEMIVSVPDQELALMDQGKLIARYPVSTSKYGTGDGLGTYRTPLGVLFVSGRFGDHLQPGAVIKNRVATGEVVDPNAPGRDAIVTRVIWLRGKESQNRAAHDRCIYIHGTPEERNIGRPASYGCIRMRSRDVMDLYRFAHIGMHVIITSKRIDSFIAPDPPAFLARVD